MSSWKRSVCGLAAAGRCATRIALGSCGASGERGTAYTEERSIFVLSGPLRKKYRELTAQAAWRGAVEHRRKSSVFSF